MKKIMLALLMSMIIGNCQNVFAAETLVNMNSKTIQEKANIVTIEDMRAESNSGREYNPKYYENIREENIKQSVKESEFKISGDYQYSILDDGTIGIERYTGNEKRLSIPKEMDGYTVSRLEANMFYRNNEKILTVRIPNSIRFINDSFSYLTNLEEIVVEENNVGGYFAEDNVLYKRYSSQIMGTGYENWLVCYPLGKSEATFIVPDFVNVIEYGFSTSGVFKHLKTIIIPTTVTGYIAEAFYIHQPMNIVFCYADKRDISNVNLVPQQIFYHLGKGSKIYVKNDSLKSFMEGRMYVCPEYADDFTKENYGCVGTEIIVDDGNSAGTVWNHATDMKFKITASGNTVYYLLNGGHTLNVLQPDESSKINVEVNAITANGEFCTDDIGVDYSRYDFEDYYGKPIYYLNRDTKEEIVATYYKSPPMARFEFVNESGEECNTMEINTNGVYPQKLELQVRTTERSYNSAYFSDISCVVEEEDIAKVVSVGEKLPEAVLEVKKAGTTSVTISAEYIDGKRYTDTIRISVTDNLSEEEKIDISSVSGLGIEQLEYVYTGNEIEIDPNVLLHGVPLTKDIDYTVTYQGDNVNAGTIENIIITGIGRYKGTRVTSATILPASIAKVSIASLPKTFYTGAEIRPMLEFNFHGKHLWEDTDYKVVYKNNTKVGTASIVCTGIGNFSGTKNITFKIEPRTITNVSSVKVQYYTGKLIEPSVVVKAGNTKLVKNQDYTIAYKQNKYPGPATLTVKGKGNYKGTKTVSFEIVVSTKKVNIVSARMTSDRKAKISWKKITTASGYQLQYGRDKGFRKGVKKIVTTAASKNISKLTKGKKYYVRVRMYRIIHGKKYYGAWSTVKSFKIR